MNRVITVALITNSPEGYFKKHFYEYFNEKFNLVFIELVDCYDYENNFRIVKSKISKYMVQYCFFQMGDLALKLHDIAKIDCIKICFVTDDDWMYSIRTRFVSNYFSYLISTHSSNSSYYNSLGISNIIYSQWACNPSLYKPFKIKKDIETSFIGGPHADRVELLRYLVANGQKIQIYGKGWDKFEDLKKYWGGYLSNLEVVEVINRSKICLNPGKSSTMRGIQVKGRTFEIAGCAAFQLTDSSPMLDEYFIRGSEIITYSNYQELLEHIKYFLFNDEEREVIAYRAYQRVILEHTWMHRLDNIFNYIFSNQNRSEIKVREEVQPDVDVIYVTNTATSLNSNTVLSLNTQSFDRFTIRIIGPKNDNSSFSKSKMYHYESCQEALNSVDCKYVMFINDGDVWEPEKIHMQVIAMERDTVDNLDFNLTNYGLYIGDSMEEDFTYSYRSLLTSNRYSSHLKYLIVPSSIIIKSRLIRESLDEFCYFINKSFMSTMLQEKIGLSSHYYNFIDLQYSLARINYSSLRNNITSTHIGDPHIFNSAWVTSKQTKQLIYRFIKRGMIWSALELLWSVLFHGPRYYNILKKKVSILK
jgi:spore maturation protein CgeB